MVIGVGGGAEVQHAGDLGQAVASDPTPYHLTGGAWSILDLSAPQSGYAFAQTPDSTPPAFVSSILDMATGNLTITFSEEIDAANVVPASIHMRESGTYTGGVTLTATELVTITDGTVISFALNVAHLEAVAAMTEPELTIDPGAVQDTSGRLIVSTFEASTATFVDAFSVSLQDVTPTGIAFSNDGTKMFMIGRSGDAVHEYALSTPFDVSTAAFVDSFSVSVQEPGPTGMAFSSDGAKMFVVGSSRDAVHEYALSPPFEASTATFVDSFSVSAQDTNPTDIAFSSDGAKMFVIGSRGDAVHEYALSTPFDVSTASFVGDTPISSQESSPEGIAFSNDGAKMFVIGNSGDDVNEYALSTPFDASTATFVDATSIRSQESTPTGIAFSSDGAKMFVIGSYDDNVNEYDLTSVYPIEVTGTYVSPPPTFVSSILGMATGSLAITFSDEIDAANVVPTKIHVRESGTYAGGVTLTVTELDTAADGIVISFTLNATHFEAVAAMTAPELTIDPGAVRDTYGSLIVGTFEASTATFVDATSISSQETAPTDIAFSSDGAKMFVIGLGGNVNEYALSTPFDASTRTWVDDTSISSQESNPQGIAFSSDGTRMFVIGYVGDDVNEYALSTPFDASTRTFVDATSISLQENKPTGIAFSSDGAKMFVVGDAGDDVNEYELSTPFDASTRTWVDATSISSQESTPTGIAFSSDGTRMFVIDDAGDDVNEYELSTPFDASTRTFVDATSISEQEDNPQGIAFSSDGAKMFVIGWQKDAVIEYDLSSVYPIAVAGTYVPPPPTFVSSILGMATGSLAITFSDEIDAANVVPAKIHVRESGNYTHGVTLTVTELDTAADGIVISFTLNVAHLEAVAAMTAPELTIDPGAVRDTSGSLIVGTFEASTASFVTATSISLQESVPTDIAFSSDGAKMFVIGIIGDDVNEYALSTPFDVSTRTFVDATSIQSQETFPTGIAFSSDGTKMFVVGDTGDDVNEYELSTPFDASTRTWVDATQISEQETGPTDIAFSSDGTKMFVIGRTGDDVNEYALSTPFDASTASFVDATQISAQETSPRGIAFSSDGAKMFVIGNSGNDVNEYNLSTPFDVSTRTWVDATSISEQDTFPTGIVFSNDGTKMFVLGNTGDDVNEYTLSSVYPIAVTSTYVPPPAFVSSRLGMATGILAITFSEEIDVASVVPASIHMRETGTYTGGVTLTATELVTIADGTVISFVLNAVHLAAVAAMAVPELTIDPGAVQDTSGRLIVGTFDASTRTFVDDTSIRSEDTFPTGIAFSIDGAKMFVIGTQGRDVNEYELSTPFDASTRTWVDATSISSQESTPTGIAFSSDGTRMFVIGITEDNVNEYALSTPFDASTLTFVDATSISSQESNPQGIAFSSDGTRMFVIGTDGDDVNEYELSTPFDASTRTWVDATSISSQETSPTGIAFSIDGAKMFVIGITGDDVNEYELSTPFDASTRTWVDATSISSQESNPQGIAFSSDGTKMFVIGSNDDNVNEYDLSSVYPIAVTGTYVQPPPTFVSSGLDFTTGNLAITFSEEIDAANVVPAKIHVRETGTYTGGVTLTATELVTIADSATIRFTLNAEHLAAVAAMTESELTIDPGAVQDTSGSLIVGTFEASTATFVDATSITSQEFSPTGIAFSSDGTKMFVIGNTGKDVNEYNLSTPFDVSTRTWVDATSISEQETYPTGIAFSSDGAKMFVIGKTGDDVNEYELSTPFDASTRTWVDATSISSQESNPTGIAFSSDGAKMFVVGIRGGDVNEYELSTPFDVSTASFVGDTPISSQESSPEGIAFSSDGTKMFVIGNSGDDVNEYKLRVPFEASTRTFVGVTSIFEENTIPTDIAFSNDGAKMFVIDNQARSVNEYDLSSAYPIVVTGTYVPPPPTFASSILDMETGNLAITFLDEIDATPAANIVPAKIHVRESGTYTGGVALTATELVTTTDGTVISFTLNAAHLKAVAAMVAPELTIAAGAVQDTSGRPIIGTFEASTRTFVGATSISEQEDTPTDIAFSSDGTKMFVIGITGGDVNEYELSAPFDVSTRTWVDATSISEQETNPRGIAFSSDGTKMFVIGITGGDVNEYELSAPFDVSTRTFVDATSISEQETAPTGIAFSSDGTKMFVIGDTGDDVNEYELSAPFDASTRTFVDATPISAQETLPTGIAFSSDGAKMFVIGDEGDDVNEYALSAPFDASTRTFVDATSIRSEDSFPTGIAFSIDGAKMFVIGDEGDDVNEYALSSVYPIEVAGTYVQPPLTFVSSILDFTTRSLVITFSEEINAANIVPAKIHVRESGTYTGGVTLTAGEHGTVADSATISFALNAVHLAAVAAMTEPKLTIDPGAVQDTSGRLIVGTFETSTATFVDATSIRSQETAPTGIAFSSDGTKMFVIGETQISVIEYDLRTPFDASTATVADITSIANEEFTPTGIAFSSDGAKMFVIGADGDDVSEYELSTPFKASTATFVDDTSTRPYEFTPTGIAFSSDGTKMFVIGLGGNVNEYNLRAPFDASTRTFVDATPISTQETEPTGIAFSSDGTKMFVIGADGDDVNEYKMSTPFEASTITFVGNTTISEQEDSPTDIAFSSDGAKMFVIGWQKDAVIEYDLSSVYPIVVAGTYVQPPPTFVSSMLDMATGSLEITFSEVIDAANIVPAKIHVRETGTYAGGVTLTATKLVTVADGAVISFTLNATHIEAVAAMAAPELTIDPGAVQDTSGSLIVGTFEASTRTFVDDTSISEQEDSPTDIAFSSDGTRMFVVGTQGGNVTEYEMSTPFDVSTLTFVDATQISEQETAPTGIAFSSDGTRMFVIGTQGGNVTEYEMSTPFDVSTLTFVDATQISEQETAPTGIAFSSDGARMFVIGDAGKDVNEYELSTPFDVSTLTFVDATQISEQETAPTGIAFSSDGTRMFVIGTQGGNVTEYKMSTPFDVSTRIFVDATPISEQENSPTGIAFSSDGAKMFVIGWQKDAVIEYDLTSVYPIAVTGTHISPPPTFVSSMLGMVTGSLAIAFSDEIDAANIVPAKIHVRETGTYVGGVTLTATELGTAADSATIWFTLNATHIEAIAAMAAPELTIDPGAVQDTSGSLIVGTFEASTRTFVDDTSISEQEDSPTDIAFSSDGTRMFVVGTQGGNVTEYELSTPFDASTRAFVSATSISEQEDNPQGIAFSSDGTRMFVVGTQGGNVTEYEMSTPFDVSTLTFVDATQISEQETAPTGIAFSSDGTRMFVIGTQGGNVTEYEMSTPFDVSTLTFVDATSISEQETAPTGIAFSSDGTRMFVVGTQGGNVTEYEMSTPFDVSTRTFVDATSISEQETAPTGIAFSSDGTRMFVIGTQGDNVTEYDLTSVYPIAVTGTHVPPHPTFVSSILDTATGNLTITFSEEIDAANIVPARIHVRESGNYTHGVTRTCGGEYILLPYMREPGTYTGGVTLTAVELDTTANGTVVLFALNATHIEAVAAMIAPELTIDPGAVRDTSGSLIVGTFDASTATFVDSFSVLEQEADPQGIAFSSDGTRMFVIGAVRDDVNEYALSTPFDTSTAVFVDDTSVSEQETYPTGIAFSSDGTKMFVIGDAGKDVNEYELSTPFDASTRTFVDATPISTQETLPRGIAFSSDGARMFVIGLDGDDVNEYALSAPFDASTRAFVDATSISTRDSNPHDIAFSSDGAKMFVICDGVDDVNEYVLSAPFDASTRTFVGSTSITLQENSPRDIAFSSDGAKMFVVGNDGDDVDEYDLTSTYPIAMTGNVAPVLADMDDMSLDENVAFTFNATATDANGDDLSFSLVDAPAGALINLTTGLFSWTPTEQQDGIHVITVQVDDGNRGTDSGNATMTVLEVNVAPVLNAIGDKGTSELVELTFTATASDTDVVDNLVNTLTFSFDGTFPSGAAITSAGVFTWTPTELQVGSHDITVQVTDGSLTDSETLTVTVNEVNVAPVLNTIDDQTVNEFVELTFTATASDDDSLTFSFDGTFPSGAAITSAGVFTWTPTESQDGDHTITVQVTDGSLTDSETLTVTVNEVNVAPVLNAIGDKGTSELVELTFTATASDTDVVDNLVNTLTFSLDGTFPSGATITSAGVFTWTPTELQVGSHDITVQVTDGSLTDSETLTVTVNEVNVAPVLNTIDDQTVNEFVELTFTATASDDDSLTFLFDGTFPSGAAITSAGVFTWTPTESQDGDHTITVQVTDGSLTDSETLTVTVNEVNVAPVLNAIGDKGTSELVELTFTATASDTDVVDNLVNTLTFSFDGTFPSGAAITSAGVFTWTPTELQVGSHDITVQVTDGSLTDSETLTVTVNEVNVAPVLNTIDDQTVNEFVELTFTAIASDDDSLTFLLDGTVPSGAAITSAGVFTWTPTESQDGDHTITVQVTDGSLTDSETLTVTVNEVNVAPVLNAIGDKGTSKLVELTFTATASDTDVVDNLVNTLTFSFDGTFPPGAAITSAGVFTWTPTELQVGSHDITVQVTDGSLTDSETLTVTVNEVNVAPVLNTIGDQTVNEFVELTFTAIASDDDSLTFSFDGTFPSGAAITSAGVFTWTPTESQDGDHTITVQVTDGSLTDSETLTVTVNEVNVAPVLNAIGDKGTSKLVELTFTATASDTDVVDNLVNTLTFSFDGTFPPGAAITSAGVFTWTPTELQVGSHDITVQVTDGSLTDSETLTVTVKDTTAPRRITLSADAFITTWRTDSANQTITIPVGGSTARYSIDWGDNSPAETDITGDSTHTYREADSYTVSISGGLERFHLDGQQPNAGRLASIEQWGDTRWTTMDAAFDGATNMVYRATDTPDLSGVTDMHRMFGDATAFNGDLSSWDVSKVTDMSNMFIFAYDFNGNLSSWDVSSVTNMNEMFAVATSFNQPLNSWNVSRVTNMDDMFYFATAFSQNLGNWYVVANATSIAKADVPRVVAEISAQNDYLNGHNPMYGISRDNDYAFFEIVNGNKINMTSVGTKSSYRVNVTASGSNVFEDGNNWRVLAVSVSAALSDNADLGSLTISSGTLSPQFSSSDITYTASVDNSVTQVTVTPTASDSSAAITVNGNDVTSGIGYILTGLTVGEPNTVTVIVTAQDSTTKTYIITLTRAALSDNADLGSLTISSGTLSPQFSSSDITYTASVDNSVTQVTVTPTASDSSAAITVNGNDVTSGIGYILTGLTVGEPNTVTVIVTAQDSTTKTYIITLTRAASLSDNADLGSLTISSGTLSPPFSSSDITYTASVDNSVTQVTVTPTASDSSATIAVNGNDVTSGIGYILTGLTVDEPNTVTVIVTAQDSTTKTYIITLTRAALSDNADLGSLTISSGTLSPPFSSSDITYTASVDNSVTQVTVTPTASDSSATITVNGNDVTSGIGYILTGLTVGEPNTVTVIVTAQDSTTKTYIITLTRAASLSDNADLGSLTISSGTLSPQFSSSDITYTASVDNSVTQVTVTPTASDSSAAITVNGNTVTSGIGYILTGLTAGEPNTVTVIVTAQDSTTKTYIITLTRAASLSDNADLGSLTISSGTLSPQFSSSDITYTASVDNSVTQVTVTPTASDSSAAITVNGNDVTSGIGYILTGLTVGEPNTVTVIVTAQDSTTKTYIITLTRAASLSDNADLGSLTISSGTLSPQFSSSDITYTASVDNSVTQVTVTPTASDSSAAITVNGNDVTSGIGYILTGLTVGEPNTVTVIVTAQDSTTKTYIITLTRAASLSDNADLGSLTISSGTLSPQFSSSDITYTASVDNSVTQVTVTPTASDSSAAITVNGNDVTSGIGYILTGLTVDEPNTVTVIVTAQDSTTKTYIITLTRAALSRQRRPWQPDDQFWHAEPAVFQL